MLEGLTLWHLAQFAILLLTAAGGWFTLKAKVGEMARIQAIHKEEMDGRFKAANERSIRQESTFDEHVKESNKAREDIAELKADIKHVVRTLDRIADRDS